MLPFSVPRHPLLRRSRPVPSLLSPSRKSRHKVALCIVFPSPPLSACPKPRVPLQRSAGKTGREEPVLEGRENGDIPKQLILCK